MLEKSLCLVFFGSGRDGTRSQHGLWCKPALLEAWLPQKTQWHHLMAVRTAEPFLQPREEDFCQGHSRFLARVSRWGGGPDGGKFRLWRGEEGLGFGRWLCEALLMWEALSWAKISRDSFGKSHLIDFSMYRKC